MWWLCPSAGAVLILVMPVLPLTSKIRPPFLFLLKGSLIWRSVCYNDGLNQSCSLQSPVITCRCTTASDLHLTVASSACVCPLPCLSDLLRAPQQQRQQCSLSRRLVGNLGCPARSDSQVSRDSVSSAQAGQKMVKYKKRMC